MPEISVVLPVRDGARTLPLAIVSVLQQSFDDFELIVLDDGSVDATADLVTRFADPRIRLVCDGEKKGLATRLNQGIDIARGNYIARMDADDVCFATRFERQHQQMQSEPTLDLLSCRALTFDDTSQVIGMFPFKADHHAICAYPWKGFYLPHPSWFGRKEWFRKHRYLMPEVVRAEDQELLLRTFRHSRFAALEEVLFGYRIGTPPLSKTLLARRNLLKVHVDYFSNRRAYLQLALALASAGAKSANDLLRGAGITSQKSFEKATPDTVEAWGKWLDGLTLKLQEYGLSPGFKEVPIE